MGPFWGRFIANVAGLVVINVIFSGVIIHGAWAFFIAALLVGFVNATIRPLVQLMALPLSIVTFGIFALVINGACLFLVALLTPGFEVGCFTAIFASIVLSFVSAFTSKAIGVEDDE